MGRGSNTDLQHILQRMEADFYICESLLVATATLSGCVNQSVLSHQSRPVHRVVQSSRFLFVNDSESANNSALYSAVAIESNSGKVHNI